MKKILCFLTVAVALTMISCFYSGRTSTDELPNGYEVCSDGSNAVVKNTADGSVVIPSFVKEYAFDGRYVQTRNVKDINDYDIYDEEYYILDTLENRLYGPFGSPGALKEKADELGASANVWFRPDSYYPHRS